MTETDKIDYFTEARSEEVVNARMGKDADPRLAEIMASLVHHLHAFAKDVELTQAEWATAIDFLTRTGRVDAERLKSYAPEFYDRYVAGRPQVAAGAR